MEFLVGDYLGGFDGAGLVRWWVGGLYVMLC